MRSDELRVRSLAAADLAALAEFRCSTGRPWENLVETQVRGPLPRRYLASPPRFDGRTVVVTDTAGTILAVGAHHVEPTMVPDVGYTEVVAVALDARGTLVALAPARRFRSAGSCCSPSFARCAILAAIRGRSRASTDGTGEASRSAIASGSPRSGPTHRTTTSCSVGVSCRADRSTYPHR